MIQNFFFERTAQDSAYFIDIEEKKQDVTKRRRQAGLSQRSVSLTRKQAR
jgi:hypothetical protein